MKSRMWQILTLILCLTLVGTAFAAEKVEKKKKPKEYTASLSGKENVPPVDTSAKGKAVFKMNDEMDGIDYSIDVNLMENITGAHVHAAPKGKNGPVVVNLLEGEAEGEVEGNLVEGVILDMDFVGPLEGKPLTDFIKLIEKGEAYVVIHTEQNPKGEIRGIIK